MSSGEGGSSGSTSAPVMVGLGSTLLLVAVGVGLIRLSKTKELESDSGDERPTLPPPNVPEHGALDPYLLERYSPNLFQIEQGSRVNSQWFAAREEELDNNDETSPGNANAYTNDTSDVDHDDDDGVPIFHQTGIGSRRNTPWCGVRLGELDGNDENFSLSSYTDGALDDNGAPTSGLQRNEDHHDEDRMQSYMGEESGERGHERVLPQLYYRGTEGITQVDNTGFLGNPLRSNNRLGENVILPANAQHGSAGESARSNGYNYNDSRPSRGGNENELLLPDIPEGSSISSGSVLQLPGARQSEERNVASVNILEDYPYPMHQDPRLIAGKLQLDSGGFSVPGCQECDSSEDARDADMPSANSIYAGNIGQVQHIAEEPVAYGTYGTGDQLSDYTVRRRAGDSSYYFDSGPEQQLTQKKIVGPANIPCTLHCMDNADDESRFYSNVANSSSTGEPSSNNIILQDDGSRLPAKGIRGSEQPALYDPVPISEDLIDRTKEVRDHDESQNLNHIRDQGSRNIGSPGHQQDEAVPRSVTSSVGKDADRMTEIMKWIKVRKSSNVANSLSSGEPRRSNDIILQDDSSRLLAKGSMDSGQPAVDDPVPMSEDLIDRTNEVRDHYESKNLNHIRAQGSGNIGNQQMQITDQPNQKHRLTGTNYTDNKPPNTRGSHHVHTASGSLDGTLGACSGERSEILQTVNNTLDKRKNMGSPGHEQDEAVPTSLTSSIGKDVDRMTEIMRWIQVPGPDTTLAFSTDPNLLSINANPSLSMQHMSQSTPSNLTCDSKRYLRTSSTSVPTNDALFHNHGGNGLPKNVLCEATAETPDRNIQSAFSHNKRSGSHSRHVDITPSGVVPPSIQPPKLDMPLSLMSNPDWARFQYMSQNANKSRGVPRKITIDVDIEIELNKKRSSMIKASREHKSQSPIF